MEIIWLYLKDAQMEICDRFDTSELILRWLFLRKGEVSNVAIGNSTKSINFDH